MPTDTNRCQQAQTDVEPMPRTSDTDWHQQMPTAIDTDWIRQTHTEYVRYRHRISVTNTDSKPIQYRQMTSRCWQIATKKERRINLPYCKICRWQWTRRNPWQQELHTRQLWFLCHQMLNSFYSTQNMSESSEQTAHTSNSSYFLLLLLLLLFFLLLLLWFSWRNVCPLMCTLNISLNQT